MQIPFFDLSRQYAALQNEMEAKVCECLRGCTYIGGPAVKQLEASLAEYLHVKHAITCGNGTDALRIALRAAGVRQGDEVITTPFTFFASAEAVAALGAIPVFVDIDPYTLNIDPALIEAAITPRTRAILPVDIFGLPVEMDAINAIAKQHHLRVVEDACQAIGAEYHGRMAGALCDVSCFSFYPTKNLAAYGDGGLISTDDDDIATLCRAYKAHGSGQIGHRAAALLGEAPEDEPQLTEQASSNGLYDPCKYYNYLIGDNSRLDSVQAAVLQVKLAHLNEFTAKRARTARAYTLGLQGTPLQLPVLEPEGVKPCWHQYAVLAPDKTALIQSLADAGIGTGAFYPVPLHLQKAFRSLGYQKGSLPNAEQACERSVCLPVFPELTEAEASSIVHAIRNHYGLA